MSGDEGPVPIGEVTPVLLDRLDRLRAKVGDAPPDDDPQPRSAEDLERLRRRHAWARLVPAVYGDPKVSDHPPAVAGPLREWVRHARLGERTNLVIYGPVGTGKSHAAFAALRPLVKDGISPIGAVEAEAMLDAYRPSTADPDEARRIRNLVDEAAALLIDDIGAEHDTEWAHARLSMILHTRWRAQVPTIVTTNVPLDDLERTLGERAASRLLDEVIVVRYSGPDRRRQETP